MTNDKCLVLLGFVPQPNLRSPLFGQFSYAIFGGQSTGENPPPPAKTPEP
ncbi:hypothetical protein [Scytonema sp. NUACC21]